MDAPDEAHEHRVAFALREAIPTRRHADLLFEMAASGLGTAARVESSPDGNHRVLYRLEGTDPRWVVPWPLLTLDRNPRRIIPLDIPGLAKAPPLPPRPGKAPNLRDLGPGSVQVQDGARYVQVAYAGDGRWFETSRGGPPTTLEGVLPLLADGPGNPVERVAGFVAALDPAARGPLRAYLPDPGAWSAWAAWFCALPRLRLLLHRAPPPPDARWIAVDPVDATAVARGATREETLAAWTAEVERVRPGSRPPEPPAPPSFEPPGEPEIPPPPDEDGPRETPLLRMEIGIGGADPALPRPPAPPPPPPGSIPAVVVPLPPPPGEPPALGPGARWQRLLGECGDSVFAALREDRDGWTLVGAPALAALGAPDAESAMDEAERARDAALRARNQRDRRPTPDTAWTVRVFSLLDPATGRPCAPETRSALLQPGRTVPVLSGDEIALGAARLRKTRD